MLAGYTQLSATAAPSTSRINTPSAWSKPQHDAVHRKGALHSTGPDNVTVHFVERYLGQNPLAGHMAAIVTDAAINYAAILEKVRVKLKDSTPEAIPSYRRLGFELAE